LRTVDAPGTPLAARRARLMKTQTRHWRATCCRSLAPVGDGARSQSTRCCRAGISRFRFDQHGTRCAVDIRRGAGNEVEAASGRRARFTLDFEPAGPVHALVS